MPMNTKRKPLHIGLSVLLLVVFVGILFYLERNKADYGIAVSVIQKSLIFAVVAVSMNLVVGFTGLFSLGQAGFMAIGAYITAILTIPNDKIDSVYYMSGVSPAIKGLKESLALLPEPVLIIFALLLGGCVASIFAFLIGIPVLRLKSDYLAIATLGFSEIVRAIISAPEFDQVTNGSYGLKNIPGFGVTQDGGAFPVGTGSLLIPFAMSAVLILFIVLVINSSYGRAFKAIREDEIAAEAMGINLLKHKELSFVISSFITAIAGGMLAMFMRSIEAKSFSIALTYDILLIVVIGGLGSVTGSVIGSFVVTFAKDWFLRFFDKPLIIGGFQVPLLRIGFRMVVFSILLMLIVLFYRRGIMGTREFSWQGLFDWLRNPFKRKRPLAAEAGPLYTEPSSGANPAPMPRAPLIPDPPGVEDETENPSGGQDE